MRCRWVGGCSRPTSRLAVPAGGVAKRSTAGGSIPRCRDPGWGTVTESVDTVTVMATVCCVRPLHHLLTDAPMRRISSTLLLSCLLATEAVSAQAVELRESWRLELHPHGVSTVARVELSHSGWIGLSDPSTGIVLVVDPAGTVGGSARLGAGGGVVGWRGDTLHVMAAGGGSIIALSTSGKAIGVIPWRATDIDPRHDSLRASGLGRPSLVRSLSSSGFAIRYPGPFESDEFSRQHSTPGTALSVVEADGRSGLLVTAPRPSCNGWLPGSRGQQILAITPFCGNPFILPAQNGSSVAVVLQDQSDSSQASALVEFHLHGQATPARHIIRRPTRPIESGQYEAALDSPNFVRRRADIARLPRPVSAPLASAAQIDRDGTVWLQLQNIEGPQEWVRVSAAAGEDGHFSVPRDVIVRAVAPNGFVVAASSIAGPTLHWYSIPH